MKQQFILLLLFSAGSLKAGTPDNSDVSYFYIIALTIIGIIVGSNYLSKYLRERKAKKLQEAQEAEFPDFFADYGE